MFKSTSTTTINSTKYKNSYTLRKEKSGLVFNSSLLVLDFIDPTFPKDEPMLVDLISDQPKVLVYTNLSYYHHYHDNFAEFLSQYEITPDAKFLVDITHIKNKNPLPEFLRILFKFMNDNKVDYRPIDVDKTNKFNINNLYYRNPDCESHAINNAPKRLYKFSQEYVKDKNAPATKKVFLSRKNYRGRDLEPIIKGRLPYQNDDRIDNEELLADYFESLGFEINVPDEFDNFEDQMNYFYQAKMIASTTSSGLTNACFMRPGSTVVEILTPLISFSNLGNGLSRPMSQGQEEIHHFYHAMSLQGDHFHVSIPNERRNAQEIIDKIEANPKLKSLLME